MTPTYDHKGFDISFDVATEEWKCGALALSNKSLTALKKLIDREGKKRRQVNVEVLYLHEAYSHRDYAYKIQRATVVLLRDGDRKADIKVKGERGNVQVDIGELYALEERAKLEAYIAAKKREQKASDESSAASDALTALTAEAIREAAVRVAEDAA